ncbi:Uncharacterized protein EbC_pEb17202150 (plasmid) [Erwinia billingiae Eb661]|uniref:Uncharacterized protein n=1 Tax=Erwinia billingiae (strain Eb661) TaxID=634500 RepID=D8MK70_ERWBE|nr:Uncharacterized protein EbC_pEb17202150 [Erwinia billingiae Eb661]
MPRFNCCDMTPPHPDGPVRAAAGVARYSVFILTADRASTPVFPY